MMITGPNMAGKSALLRQTALIVLMAQMGSFVPASSAHIGVVDKIFTRVGASDNISQGESTFMVEMLESASIMNNLSDRSLILLDEIGRGTSTYDGMSIAWAMVEYIHNHPAARAKTMFATHYHELNELEELLPRVKNYNVSVKEVNRTILFLRKLVRGGTEHSFGIHVAKMAGMPVKVIERAEAILASLEGAGRAAAGAGEETGSDVREEAAVPAGVRAVAKPSGRGKGRKTSGAEEHLPGVQLSMFQLEDPVLVQIRDQIRGARHRFADAHSGAQYAERHQADNGPLTGMPKGRARGVATGPVRLVPCGSADVRGIWFVRRAVWYLLAGTVRVRGTAVAASDRRAGCPQPSRFILAFHSCRYRYFSYGIQSLSFSVFFAAVVGCGLEIFLVPCRLSPVFV